MGNKLNKVATPAVNIVDRNPTVDYAGNCKYYTNSITLTMKLKNIDDKNPVNLASYLYGLSIENSYEKYFCPIVKLVMNIPKNIAFSIHDNFRDSPLVLSISNHIASGVIPMSFSSPETILDAVELEIVKIDGPAFTDDNSVLGDLDQYPDNNTNNSIAITIYAFESKALAVKRPLLNNIYSNVTMEDVINMLVTKNITDRDIIIDKPDNMEVYEQVVMPPLNFPDALEYLQAFYGIYKSGIQVFMDFNKFYIISKDTSATHAKDIVDMTIRVRNSKQMDGIANAIGTKCMYVDEEHEVVNLVLDTKPIIESGDVLSKEIVGEQLYVKSNKELGIGKGGGGINPSENGKERYLWSRSNSEFTTNQITLNINRRTEFATLTCVNSDYRYFNPLMKIKLGYAYKMNDDVSAEYRFSMSHIVFNRVDEEVPDKTYENMFSNKIFAKFMRV